MLGSYPAIVTLTAFDLTRAENFYTKVVGLKQVDLPGVPDTSMFEAGKGTQVVIYKSDAAKPEQTSAIFSVDDIESAVDSLSSKGVAFEQYDYDGLKTDARGIAAMGGAAKSAWFKDTEGNTISIVSM